MSGPLIAALAFAALFLLLALRIPIGVAMFAVGALGYASLAGLQPLLSSLESTAFDLFANYSFSVVPLFLLMGEFAARAGMSRALFDAARLWLGHRPGGLAMAAIGACAGFGAICGSSLATAATMGRVALPEMRRHGYSGALATGTIAAGGTLGILIPPSLVLVIYAILAEQNIAELFAAALIPGILAALGYMAAIAFHVRLHPQEGPAGTRAPRGERLRALARTWPVLLIFTLVIGGIYAGLFTPTEGAAVGATGVGLLALARGGLDFAGLLEVLRETARSVAMIFLILLGATIFNVFLALTRTPQMLATWIGDLALPPLLVVAAMLLFYFLFGCVMDSLSMILLTVPIFVPVVLTLDLGLDGGEVLIWFGILALVSVEVGLITPPVGLNVFVINAMAEDVPMRETFLGVAPFLLSDLVRIFLLLLFPSITLALVHLLF